LTIVELFDNFHQLITWHKRQQVGPIFQRQLAKIILLKLGNWPAWNSQKNSHFHPWMLELLAYEICRKLNLFSLKK
jgi:hypothetical protein